MIGDRTYGITSITLYPLIKYEVLVYIVVTAKWLCSLVQMHRYVLKCPLFHSLGYESLQYCILYNHGRVIA